MRTTSAVCTSVKETRASGTTTLFSSVTTIVNEVPGRFVGATGIEGRRGLWASSDDGSRARHKSAGHIIRFGKCELLLVNCTYYIFAEPQVGCLAIRDLGRTLEQKGTFLLN